MKKFIIVAIALMCGTISFGQQTPDLHAPTANNNTGNYWGAGVAPPNYNFPTNESVVIDFDANCGGVGSDMDTCANQFPAFVVRGTATSAHSALIFGTNGAMQLRRTFNSTIGMDLQTMWTNETGSLNTTGGYIRFMPRGTTPTSSQYLPVEAMRIIPGGNVGIGLITPTEQLHTNSGVRFAGLTSTSNPPRTVVSDANGKLFYVTGAPVTTTCTSTNFVPRMSGTNTMSCSIIQQSDVLTNCNSIGVHSGIGINGTPTATAMSGANCHNIFLTVNGSAFATSLWIASDKRIKKDIESISSGLDKVLHLRGVNYGYDNRAFPEMELPSGTTAGFIAQELQEVIPEAVAQTEKGLHVVNYDVVIPYLVSAIQEQNTVIEDQKQMLLDMAQRLQALESKVNGQVVPQQMPQSAAPSHQLRVSPNPFGNQLTVSYQLAEAGKSADIRFKLNDASGKEVFTKMATDATGDFTIESTNLASGTYFLSFFVNGKLVDTKQVVK